MEDESYNLNSDGFMLAFGIDNNRGEIGEIIDDPRMLKWVAVLNRRGRSSNTITKKPIPVRKCSPDDYGKFFSTDKSTMREIQNY